MVETVESAVYETTPSGIEIRYQAKPKREYRLRHPDTTRHFDVDGKSTDGWRVVPSVTDILGCLDKGGGLVWWGMRVGIEGCVELARRDEMDISHVYVTDETFPVTAADIEEALVEAKLDVNNMRNKAGDRGVNVHTALEAWASTGHLPHPPEYPEEERGYVQGLLAFLVDANLEPIRQEVMVGSIEHGFAGRYDIEARVTKPSPVVVKIYPKRDPKLAVMPQGVGIFDLKTSADVYPTHLLQLEGYEGARLECGYEPTDWRVVVRVTSDGRYEVVRSRVTFADFLKIKDAYDAVQRAKEAIRR